MPKGEPKRQTIATAKYQKKVGLIVKGFKIRKEIADRFAKACEKEGVSQASKITELMEQYSRSVM